MKLLTLALVFLLSLAALAQAPKDDLKAVDVAFARATQQLGLEGWMSFFADDAYVGNNPKVQGKLALRDFYKGLFARRDLKFEWTPDAAQVFPSGNMGYTSGRYTRSFTNYQGATTMQTGSYLTVWQKQPDGEWKVLADFGSQDKPAAAAQPASGTTPPK